MSPITFLIDLLSHPLNRHNKWDALERLARWQLGSRLLHGPVVYDWIGSSKLLVRNGETGLTGNIYLGLHEFADMGFLLHVLRDDDLFVDVGANAGSYTVLASAARRARTMAFEPLPSVYNRLVGNVHLNCIEHRVRCFNEGIGEANGTLKFTSDLDTLNHVLAPDEKPCDSVSVPVTTLDAALKDESPVIIKIDVEGFETPVLKGAAKTLCCSSLLAIIMELNGRGLRYGYDEKDILANMVELGFGAYTYDPLSRTLAAIDGKNLSECNTLFVRNEAAVLERLRTAPAFRVLGASI
jgi:FkbM family methyltransferase